MNTLPAQPSAPLPSGVARGGKAIYGAPLGILMLEARFPRIPGDMGNAGTWPFPVLYRVVKGASPERVVLQGARGLLPDFLDAAEELVGLGAEAVTTNCGFLSLFQRELAERVKVPVATSSLMQVPWVQAMLPPGRRVGLITVCATTLTPAHLAAVGVPADTPVVGTERGREFFRVLIRAEKQDMNIAAAEQDILDAGRALVARHPEVGAIVLECTNMPPYAAALQDALGLPVYDIYSMIGWFHAGLRPRKLAAIRELGMARNTKLQLQFADRAWVAQGGNGETRVEGSYHVSWDVSRGQPGAAGILNFYSGGATAVRAGDGTPEERARLALADLERIHPGIGARWNGRAIRNAWDRHPWSRGSYSLLRPGQYVAFHGVEHLPEGRIHFAGEQSSQAWYGYLNGAVESGLRAAREIVRSAGAAARRAA